jgi:hypothetical protein
VENCVEYAATVSLRFMSEMFIRRGRGGSGLLRHVVVKLDGQKVGALLPGDAVAVQAPSGVHVVQARLDWTTSSPVTIAISESLPACLEFSTPWSSFSKGFTFKGRHEAIECRVDAAGANDVALWLQGYRAR